MLDSDQDESKYFDHTQWEGGPQIVDPSPQLAHFFHLT